MESYYDLLGVDRDASTAEIERAYREKLKETHPDVSDDEDAGERTKRLIDAKEVLTDPRERERYDRLGHDAYVTTGDGPGSGTPGETATGREGATTAAGEDSTRRQGRNRHGAASATAEGVGRDDGDEERTAGTRGADTSSATGFSTDAANAAGADSRRRRRKHVRDESWNTDSDTKSGRWSTWNTDGSYAVRRENQSLGGPQVLTQRSLVLLVVTFLVYPVLLFGALLPTFPLAVNIAVGVCLVLVVAFLQSVPDVAVVLFGLWAVIMPIGLFGVVGVDPISVISAVALASVFLPLGLSVLTWVAMRPVSAT